MTENDNVYVTGLPSDIDEQSLKKVFGIYGSVHRCKVLPPTAQGHGRGAALVQYATIGEATWVVTNLNGNVPQGLTEPVLAKFANKNESGKSDARGDAGGSYGPSRSDAGNARYAPYTGRETSTTAPSDNLYVTGLPPNLDNDLLRQFFSAYGPVSQCKVLPPRPDATSCVALVRFANLQVAMGAKDSLDGTMPPGRSEQIRVTFATQTSLQQLDRGGGVPVMPAGTAKGDPKGGAPKGKFSIKSLISGFESSGALPAGLAGLGNEDKAVYVAGLPSDCEDIHLYQLFAPFGPIAPKGVRPMRNPDGTCKGFGFVNFLLAESAQAAIGIFNGCELPDGTLMRASVKRQSSGRPPTYGAAPQVTAPPGKAPEAGRPGELDMGALELANLDMGGSFGY